MNPMLLAGLQAVNILRRKPTLARPLFLAGAGVVGLSAVAYVLLPKPTREKLIGNVRRVLESTPEGSPFRMIGNLLPQTAGEGERTGAQSGSTPSHVYAT